MSVLVTRICAHHMDTIYAHNTQTLCIPYAHKMHYKMHTIRATYNHHKPQLFHIIPNSRLLQPHDSQITHHNVDISKTKVALNSNLCVSITNKKRRQLAHTNVLNVWNGRVYDVIHRKGISPFCLIPSQNI